MFMYWVARIVYYCIRVDIPMKNQNESHPAVCN